MTFNNFYIYSICDYSVKSAATTRMFYYAKVLADEENRVYMVSCCSDRLAQDKFVEVEPNIFVLENKKLTDKYFSIISFLISLNDFSKAKQGENRFIFDSYSYFFIHLMSVLYMIFMKKHRVYYELNEVVSHSSYFHDSVSFRRIKYSLKKWLYRPLFRMADALLPFYEGLICISTPIEAYGKRYNKNTLRIPILTNSKFTVKKSNKTYAKKDYFNIGFSGSIVPSKENLFEFVEVLKELKKNGYKIAFNLCGLISKRDHEILIGNGGMENNIHYYGNLDERELSGFLGQQDLLVVPRGYTLQNKYGFSTKLSDYLNHKKMVLVTDISDNGLYIKDGVNGFVVPPDDKRMMFEKLMYILDNFKELEASITANAQQTSKEKFDYRLYKETLHSFLTRGKS